MKTLLIVLLLLLRAFAFSQGYGTPVYMNYLNNSGSGFGIGYTVTYAPYPPPASATNFGIASIGTNFIANAPVAATNVMVNGYWSNSIAPGTYKFTIQNIGYSFFATIPSTTNLLSLAMLATSVPNYSTPQTSFQIITNMLGYTPQIALAIPL